MRVGREWNGEWEWAEGTAHSNRRHYRTAQRRQQQAVMTLKLILKSTHTHFTFAPDLNWYSHLFQMTLKDCEEHGAVHSTQRHRAPPHKH